MLSPVVIPSRHSPLYSLPLGHCFSITGFCWDTTPLSSLGSCPAIAWLGVTMVYLSCPLYTPALPQFVHDDGYEKLESLSVHLRLKVLCEPWPKSQGPLAFLAHSWGTGRGLSRMGTMISLSLNLAKGFSQRTRQPQLSHPWNNGWLREKDGLRKGPWLSLYQLNSFIDSRTLRGKITSTTPKTI